MTQTDSLANAKQRMREQMGRVRAGLTADAAARAAQSLAARGMEALAARDSAMVAGYAPMPGEIDVVPLMRRLRETGHGLCLPLVEAPGLPLTFRRWVPGEPLAKGRMGVLVPAAASAQATPGILLVPLIAFDRSGYRLGLGAGFYDRTLEVLRQAGDVFAAGVAFDEQEVEAVPHGAHDQRLDVIVTPSAVVALES